MPQEKKYLATGLLILTIFIVIFLASGISDVEFQPGTLMALDRGQNEFSPPMFPKIPTAFFEYLLMFTMWVMLPLSVVFFIKYPEIRQRTLKGLSYFILYGFCLFLLTRKNQEDSPEFMEAEQELVDITIIETQREAAEFISSVGEADQSLNLITDIAIFILIGLLLWYVYRRFFYEPPSTSDQIKAEVEGAIDQIESGVDLRNVIIRCYADMSQILIERRGIQRNRAMTPHEFELELQEVGLPHSSVQNLTRLFEAVRYGNAQLSSEDEQEAIHCLNAIAEAC
jgi:hypothetical protein